MRKLTILVLLLAFISSCVPKKRLTYLQEKERTSNQYPITRTPYQVQPNDILSITIRTYDAETAQLFNITSLTQQNALQAGDILFYLQGYSVNLDGNITLPILGELNVLDKTVEEIQNQVETALSPYFLEEAINVTVQIAGIRFSVVGEVNRPGKYVIYQNQVNIFEALAQSGDISIVGDRKNVMLLRQNLGSVETIYLDLTDADVIKNPDYFIQPNDIINVMPLSQKSYGIGTTGFQTFSQLLSVIASTITLVIAINSLN